MKHTSSSTPSMILSGIFVISIISSFLLGKHINKAANDPKTLITIVEPSPSPPPLEDCLIRSCLLKQVSNGKGKALIGVHHVANQPFEKELRSVDAPGSYYAYESPTDRKYTVVREIKNMHEYGGMYLDVYIPGPDTPRHSLTLFPIPEGYGAIDYHGWLDGSTILIKAYKPGPISSGDYFKYDVETLQPVRVIIN